MHGVDGRERLPEVFVVETINRLTGVKDRNMGIRDVY